MPLVFILVASLFWLSVVTVVAFAQLSRSTFRWVAALGHGPRGWSHTGRVGTLR